MKLPETRYAKSGGVHVAYQTFGQGGLDLVVVPGWASHIEYAWEEPRLARFLEQLGRFARVTWFDKRGTGLSDRVTGVPILEERMDDVRAVMDAASIRRAAILGWSEGGSMATLFAASSPDRVQALILFGAFAKRLRSPDYPWAPTLEERMAWISQIEAGWGGEVEVETLAPSMKDDPMFRRWFAAYGRLSVSPAAAVALATMNTSIDIRAVLGSVHVPTLVLHRTGDRDSLLGNGQYLASHIPGAKFVELPGEDHTCWTGDSGRVVEEIQEFLTGARSPASVDRVLLSILFTDIIGSTELASKLGDRSWRDLLDRHNHAVRAQLSRFRGREVKTTGDGFLAVFDGPARAIRSAEAIRRATADLGLQVRLGIHTGECELLDGDVAGVGVHIAARVAAQSSGRAVLVTSTVKNLTAGAGIQFTDAGLHSLKGVEGSWHLYEAVAPE